ncbi:hypothetical protein ACQCPQ_31460 (plasmid) [Priestia megaterium]|uniref:hypothetical protein n=1 Tax=Priestia megaterium TaxID=1404 RepID=UPI003CFCEA30
MENQEVKKIKESFFGLSKEEIFLDHLWDRDEMFWEGISFINKLNVQKLKNEEAWFSHARFLITGRIINHLVASYQMLKMGLEDEFLILHRQSLENIWLLKYFIENPSKTEEWIKEGAKIHPWQRREALDDTRRAKKVYDELCDVVHSNHKSFWGVCVGGMINKPIIDHLFSNHILRMNELLSYLDEIIKKYDEDLFKEYAQEFAEITNKLNVCLCISRYLLNPDKTKKILKANNNEDVIKYLQSKYEIS